MCTHPQFTAHVSINRLEDVARFSADVRITCAACGVAMRFLGLPGGLDLNGAAVSPDGTEARLAISPVGEGVPRVAGGQPIGFRINHSSR